MVCGEKIMRLKFINLKPNFKKVAVSIVISLASPLIYWLLTYRHTGCIQGFPVGPLPICDKVVLLSCCPQYCIHTSEQTLLIMLFWAMWFISHFMIIYIIWSLVEARFNKR